MTNLTCLSCQATTTNGLALCELCQRYARTCLDVLPVYFRNLARWRPGRAGSRPVPGSRPPVGAFGVEVTDGISGALDEAGSDIVGWARMLADDRVLDLPTGADSEAEQIALLCEWLADNLTSVATLEWAGEFVRGAYDKDQDSQGVGYHEERLRTLTETVVPGWYAGTCRRMLTAETACGARTYVIPGFTWVTCGRCGATTYARDHLEFVLEEARSWVATPKQLAQVLVAMVDTEQSVESLRKRIAIWGKRDHLHAIRPNDYAPKRYAFGEVFDLLATRGPTRTDLPQDETEAC